MRREFYETKKHFLPCHERTVLSAFWPPNYPGTSGGCPSGGPWRLRSGIGQPKSVRPSVPGRFSLLVQAHRSFGSHSHPVRRRFRPTRPTPAPSTPLLSAGGPPSTVHGRVLRSRSGRLPPIRGSACQFPSYPGKRKAGGLLSVIPHHAGTVRYGYGPAVPPFNGGEVPHPPSVRRRLPPGNGSHSLGAATVWGALVHRCDWGVLVSSGLVLLYAAAVARLDISGHPS